jgi:integrase
MYKLYRRKGSPNWNVSWTIDGDRVRRSLGTDDESVARIKAADEHRKALIGDITGERHSITLDQALGRYVMEHARFLPSLKTVAYQAKSLRRLIGKNTPLSAIDDTVAASFVARRRGEKARRGKSSRKNRGSVPMDRLISSTTVNKEMSLLRAVMNRARTEWKCAVGEVDWKKRRLQEAEGNTRWLTQEQAMRVIAAAAPHVRGPLTAAICTGLRASNVMRLDWSQIDMPNRSITVRVKSKKPGGKVLSLRMAQPLFIALSKLNPKDEGRVFLYRGRPIKTDVRRAFLTALKKAKIPGKFTWHDLRHTAASWMVQTGASIAEVRDALGHSDIKLTQRYTHVATSQVAAAIDRLGDMFSGTAVAQPIFKKAANS